MFQIGDIPAVSNNAIGNLIQDSTVGQQPLTPLTSSEQTTTNVSSPTENPSLISSKDTQQLGEIQSQSDTQQVSNISAAPTTVTNVPHYEPTPNVLHNFASYTYNISLHALDLTSIKSLLNDPTTFTPDNVLIAGGGRFNQDGVRNSAFKDDFYFDSLSMTSVIGGEQARESNVIHIAMTIIEPYGMTLLNRLIDVAGQLNLSNHMENPYLLKIDFFGYDSTGTPNQLDNTKLIPIKFIKMDMKVSTKGSEYNIEAIPFTHQAFEEISVTTPIKVEVQAAKFGNFFASTSNASLPGQQESYTKAVTTAKSSATAVSTVNARIDEINAQLLTEKDPGVRKSLTSELAYDKNLSSTYQADYNAVSFMTSSYTDALNAWLQQQVIDKVVSKADVIAFDIDPDIAASPFINPLEVSKDMKPMNGIKNPQNSPSSTKISAGGSTTGITTTIAQGSTFNDVVKAVISNTRYFCDQITDPAAKNEVNKTSIDDKKKKCVQWYKIIPKVEIIDYDKASARFVRKLTYRIIKSVVYNATDPAGPMAPPDGSVKEYEYIFTGKNTDIIDFKLEFNALFYTALTSNTANRDTVSGAPDAIPSEEGQTEDQRQKMLSDAKVKIYDDTNVDPSFRPKQRVISGVADATGLDNSKAGLVSRVQKNMLSSSVDMIQVDLQIVGDPDFIKQDDILYFPNFEDLKKNNFRCIDGSIATDSGQVYVSLKFKTPFDYNSDGLAIPSTGKYAMSPFSGLYQVLTVESTFSGGKFEQKLSLVRHALQPTPGIETNRTTTDNTRDNTSNSTSNADGTRTTADDSGTSQTSQTTPPAVDKSTTSPTTNDNIISANTASQFGAIKSNFGSLITTNSAPVNIDSLGGVISPVTLSQFSTNIPVPTLNSIVKSVPTLISNLKKSNLNSSSPLVLPDSNTP